MTDVKRTILVSGAPGTGKSTVRHNAPYYFRQRFGEAAAFDTDEFYSFFDPDWTINNRGWWRISRDACFASAQYLLLHGVDTVLISSNGLYMAEDVNAALAQLHPCGTVYHITLEARHDVVVERVRQRGDLEEHPPDWLAAWLSHIRKYIAPWTCVIDTSDLTPHAVLDAINEHVQHPDCALPVMV